MRFCQWEKKWKAFWTVILSHFRRVILTNSHSSNEAEHSSNKQSVCETSRKMLKELWLSVLCLVKQASNLTLNRRSKRPQNRFISVPCMCISRIMHTRTEWGGGDQHSPSFEGHSRTLQQCTLSSPNYNSNQSVKRKYRKISNPDESGTISFPEKNLPLKRVTRNGR